MTAKAPIGNKRPFRMLSGISTLADLVDGGAAVSSLVANGGNWYYCDPTHGTTGGDGLTAATANSNLKTVYDMTRDGYNDGVFFIAGATAYNPAAAFDWAHSYTHLIGLSSDLPGRGQRCRVVALAATDLDQAMTISGAGCTFSNIQFNNEHATGAATGSAVVTGLRNMFTNCFFMLPSSRTAASWALKVDSSENCFVRCSIGQITNLRSAADYGLWLDTPGSSNKFISCEFVSWSDTTTHVHVYIDAACTGEGWQVQFEDCMFENYGAGTLAYAISDNATDAYHQVIFRGNNNMIIKATAVSTQLAYTYVSDALGAHAKSGLMAVNVIES